MCFIDVFWDAVCCVHVHLASALKSVKSVEVDYGVCRA